MAPPVTGTNGATSDPIVAQAVSTARTAMTDYGNLQAQLYTAQNAQQSAAIESNMEQNARGALQSILSLVADVTTASPRAEVSIYQTAKDALGAGNSSGDVMTRINYDLGALNTIITTGGGTN
ncbi:MAG TPA: hypothetical protein V6D47_11825 [Oscillatoriaceae cyanobacterium]